MPATPCEKNADEWGIFNMYSREVQQLQPKFFQESQPRNAQVPPKGFLSTCTIFQLALAHLPATTDPPEPVPITIRSKFFLLIQTNNKICFPEWADRHYPRTSRTRNSRRLQVSIPHDIQGTPRKTGRRRWA